MWIRERFFDTSKRRERGGVSRLLVWAVLWALLGANGCVVTDKIEFKDWVNHQISIEGSEPAPPLVLRYPTPDPSKSRVTFTVKVSDEDVWDTEDVDISGRLQYRLDNWREAQSAECGDPSAMTEDQREGEPPVFTIKCSIVPEDTGMGVDNFLYITLVVSDLGFNRSAPAAGATTAEVRWILQKVETIP